MLTKLPGHIEVAWQQEANSLFDMKRDGDAHSSSCSVTPHELPNSRVRRQRDYLRSIMEAFPQKACSAKLLWTSLGVPALASWLTRTTQSFTYSSNEQAGRTYFISI